MPSASYSWFTGINSFILSTRHPPYTGATKCFLLFQALQQYQCCTILTFWNRLQSHIELEFVCFNSTITYCNRINCGTQEWGRKLVSIALVPQNTIPLLTWTSIFLFFKGGVHIKYDNIYYSRLMVFWDGMVSMFDKKTNSPGLSLDDNTIGWVNNII